VLLSYVSLRIPERSQFSSAIPTSNVMMAIGQQAALPPRIPLDDWEDAAGLEPAAGASGLDLPAPSVSGVRAGGVIIVLPSVLTGG